MYIGKELSDQGDYICNYCGLVDDEVLVRKHIWRNHRKEEINRTITLLDPFLRTVSNRFIKRYKLLVEKDDLLQYLRTSIFILLNDHYNPTITTPEYFSKASCNIFLKRFLQEYNYKCNSIHRCSSLALETGDSADGNVDIKDDYIHEQGKITKSHVKVLVDVQGDEIHHTIEVEDMEKEILSVLTPTEKEIFKYMTDPSVKFTQKMIALSLGISQPMVSYRIKSIRKKAKNLLFGLKK